MDSGPSKLLLADGLSHDGLKNLKNHWLDTHINDIRLASPDKNGHCLDALVSTLNARNYLHRIRHDNTMFGAYFLPAKVLVLGAAKAYKKQWDLGPSEGIHSLSLVDDPQHVVDEAQQLKLIRAIDASIQTNISLRRIQFTEKSFKALMNKLSGQLFEKLDLTGCPLDNLIDKDGESLLVKAIADNQLQAKHLVLNTTQLSQPQITQLVAALETNYHIETLETNAALTESQHDKMEALLRRNAWLNQIQKDNPYDVLKLRGQKMEDWQFTALAPLIEKGRYRKIETGRGAPNSEAVLAWLKVLRDNPSFGHLCFDDSKADEVATHKVQRQVNANRTIRKIFGKGNPLFSRSALMFGLVGGNFLYTIAATLMSPYAFVFGAIGFTLFGGLRVAANAYFHHNLKATKKEGYWDNASNQDKYDTGRECAKSWAPWFSYKAWTTPGYMGHIQAKNNWEPAVHDSERPKPTI